MAKQEDSVFSRLTKLFRSGPVIKRRVRDFTPSTKNTSAFELFRKTQSHVYSSAMSAYGSYDRMARYSDFQEMERQTWISGEELDFSAESDLEGINDVVLTASPLAVSGTSLVVSALLLDKSHFVDGLLVGDFKIKKNGVAVTASAVVADSVAKTYTFTIPAASAGTYTISTWDSALSSYVVLKAASGLLYKSNVASVVVA